MLCGEYIAVRFLGWVLQGLKVDKQIAAGLDLVSATTAELFAR